MGILKTARLYARAALKMALSSSVPTQVSPPRAVRVFETTPRPMPEPGRVRILLAALGMGQPGEAYLSERRCHRCATASLGRRDVALGPFLWPEHAVHLIEKHQVWTEGCDALVDWMIGDIVARRMAPPRGGSR